MNEPSENGQSTPDKGGIGGSLEIDQRTAGKDLRLIRLAVANGWNVSGPSKRIVVEELALLVARRNRDGSRRDVADREIIGASKALIAADASDIRVQLGAEDKGISVNVGVQANVVMPARELLQEPEYLEYLRARAIAADSQPGVVCEGGERGQVEGSRSLNGDRPPSNNGDS